MLCVDLCLVIDDRERDGVIPSLYELEGGGVFLHPILPVKYTSSVLGHSR